MLMAIYFAGAGIGLFLGYILGFGVGYGQRKNEEQMK